MAKIYLCAKTEDQEFALRVRHILKQQSHQVYLDLADQESQSDSARIIARIRHADFVLFILNASSLNSPHVLDRLNFAVELNKNSIYVLVDELTGFDDDEIIDATSDQDKALQHIVQRVQAQSNELSSVSIVPAVLPGRRIYISVAPQDYSTALEFAAALQREGHAVQLSPVNEKGIDPALQHYTTLHVREADVCIVLLSSNAVRSGLVRHETSLIRAHDKPVVPVLLHTLPEGIELQPGSYVDATRYNFDYALQEVVRRIRDEDYFTPRDDSALARSDVAARDMTRLRQFIALSLRRNRNVVAASAAVGFVAVLFLAVVLGRDSNKQRSLADLPTRMQIAAVKTDDQTAAVLDPTDTETATGTNSPTSTRRPRPTSTEDGFDLFADFSADPLEGGAPLSVFIENYSEGNIIAFAWDFNGDGIVDSTEADPLPFTYHHAGEYELSLTIFDAQDQSDTFAQYITVFPAQGGVNDTVASADPVVSLEDELDDDDSTNIEGEINLTVLALPDIGEAPLTVHFGFEATGGLARFEWDFDGDSVIDSTKPDPDPYVYHVPGKYIASLTAFTPSGRRVRDLIFVTVEGSEPPYAAFDVNPDYGEAPLTVQFTNRSDGAITGYAWDFNGDGVIDSTEENPPAYTYTQPGEYEISLVVSGTGGTSNPEYMVVYVDEPDPPFALFDVSPYFGEAPLTVQFTNWSEGTITGYAWDFNGDGVTDSTQENPPAYTYAQPGEYEISLVVSGPGGASDSATLYVIVQTKEPPEAYFVASASYGQVPLTVSFSVVYTYGEISQYQWDFNGDGVVDSTQRDPTPYTYSQPGTYTASLTVAGPGGTSSPEYKYITVESLPRPTAAFTLNPDSGQAPLTVQFTNQSQGSITGYAWDFNGDGVIDSTQANPPAYTYTQPGEYEISLVVSGPGGTSDPASGLVTVNLPNAPTAQFVANPTAGVAPLTVQFTNQSSGDITSYAWDFNGDGVIDSTSGTPGAFTYQSAGTYQARLVVSGPGGTSAPFVVTIEVQAPTATPVTSTLTLTSTITPTPTPTPTSTQIRTPTPTPIPAPTASFQVNMTSGIAPLAVQFTNQSTGQITGYAWDFNGDGVIDSTSGTPGPFTYQSAGTYQARLVVSGPGGTSAPFTVTLEIYAPTATPVTPTATQTPTATSTPTPTPTATPTMTPVPAPVASFSVDVESGVAPLTVQFTDQSTGHITDYAWDFNGDGVIDSTAGGPNSYVYQDAGHYEAQLIVSGPGGTSAPFVVAVTAHSP